MGQAPTGKNVDEALAVLNDMMYSLEASGIDMRLRETRTAEFVLADTFSFWVPPQRVKQETVNKFAYQGTWDADANSPSLSSGVGTDGYVYKVSTAGGTDLDDVTSAWIVGDYLMFGDIKNDHDDRTDLNPAWSRGIDSRRYNEGLSAMLALRLSEEFGYQLSESMIHSAKLAQEQLFAAFQKPRTKGIFDTGIVYSPTWSRFLNNEVI